MPLPRNPQVGYNYKKWHWDGEHWLCRDDDDDAAAANNAAIKAINELTRDPSVFSQWPVFRGEEGQS